eukprot:gene11897-10282_t
MVGKSWPSNYHELSGAAGYSSWLASDTQVGLQYVLWVQVQ